MAGEVEWTALLDANRSDLCLLMVNSKNEPHTVQAVNVAMRKAVDRGAKWGGGENIK